MESLIFFLVFMIASFLTLQEENQNEGEAMSKQKVRKT